MEDFFFFLRAMREAPRRGMGAVRRIKGGQGLAFTGLPTCSSSPGALVQLGDSDAGIPTLGMEGGQEKRAR